MRKFVNLTVKKCPFIRFHYKIHYIEVVIHLEIIMEKYDFKQVVFNLRFSDRKNQKNLDFNFSTYYFENPNRLNHLFLVVLF